MFRLSSSCKKITGINLKAIDSSKKVLKVTGPAFSRINSVIISARTVRRYGFSVLTRAKLTLATEILCDAQVCGEPRQRMAMRDFGALSISETPKRQF